MRVGEERLAHTVLGRVAVKGKMDVATASECMGRMRAGECDAEAIAELAKKVGKEEAEAVEQTWREMDRRRVRVPETVVLSVGEGEGRAREEAMTIISAVLDCR